MSAGPAPRPPEAHHCPITMLAPGWRASHLQVVVTQAFFEYIKRRYLPYVSKEGTLIEIGVKPMENGKKRKLLEFKEAIDLGKNVLEIADSPSLFGTFLQYRSGLMAYSEYKRFKQLRTNREAPEVYIRIGPPGTGKTRWLDEHYGLDKWIEAQTTPENGLMDATLPTFWSLMTFSLVLFLLLIYSKKSQNPSRKGLWQHDQGCSSAVHLFFCFFVCLLV